MAEKKAVSVQEVVADINSGMTDEQLMTKYGLSTKGLESLFDKLLKAKLVTQSMLDQRDSPQATVLGLSAKEQRSEARDETAFQNLFGDWYGSKTALIFLLTFATPVGLYGLYRTSIFSRNAKIAIAILSAIWAIAVIRTGVGIWLLGIIGIGAYALYRLLPLGKAARIATATVTGLLVVVMVAPFIETDSQKGKTAPAQSTATTQPSGAVESVEKSRKPVEAGSSEKLLCRAVLKCIEKTVTEVKRAGEYTRGCSDAINEYVQTVKELVPGAERWDQLPLDQVRHKMDQLPTHAKFPYHILQHSVICYKPDPSMPERIRRQNCDRVTEIVSEFRKKCSDLR